MRIVGEDLVSSRATAARCSGDPWHVDGRVVIRIRYNQVKLLLDAHVSGQAVGTALAARGHDIRALDSMVGFEGLGDPDVLAFAASEGRILVTANIKDLVRPALRLERADRSHAGLVLVPSSVGNEDFGILITGIHAVLGVTTQDERIDRVMWLESE